mmetsp:Transcript_604/g.1813  ORF Transcript_604/g.1813 Transcript_604/m.1813 type:complete len:284 (-) Transcript_604:647-1498(-)
MQCVASMRVEFLPSLYCSDRRLARRKGGRRRGCAVPGFCCGSHFVSRDLAAEIRCVHRVWLPKLFPSTVDEVKAAHARFVPAQAALHVNEVQDVVEHRVLHVVVVAGVGCERRGRVHLDEPGFELIVKHDVISVQFEAVLVVDHDFLDAEQRAQHDVLDVFEELVDALGAKPRHEVEFEISNIPLAPGLTVVVFGALLHSHIREVDVVVADIARVGRVAAVAEPSETASMQVDRERGEVGHQGVDAEVELLAADEIGVGDVSLDHVRLDVRGLGFPAAFASPL